MPELMKPDCYKCKYRGALLGSAHSSCYHPSIKAATDNPMANFMATFASVGRMPPVLLEALNVRGKEYGIRNGWFNWPWNFDPIWLESCDGYEEKPDA